MWLFWTGSETVALNDLCCMYLWPFAIGHFFRFCQAASGVECQSVDPNRLCRTDHWMWLCALAFWQLLLIREDVEAGGPPAWYPTGSHP